MQQNQSNVNKLQSLCNNQIDDPNLFGLLIYDFMAEYDKNVDLGHINTKILGEAKNNAQLLQDLTEAAEYEMELAYYEYRDYQTKKYGKNYHPIFNDVFAFELYRDSNMAAISNPMIAKYRILRDFVWSLAENHSKEAKCLLKKSAVLDEEGRVQECIFTPSFYLWNSEKNRLEDIQQTRIWYSWDKLARIYINYGQGKQELKKENIPDLRVHMNRILRYTIDFFERQLAVTQEKVKYTISYDPNNGKLKINDGSTNFKKNSDSRIVLKMLIPGDSFIKKRALKFETISEKIMNNDHAKEGPDIYEICRSINKNVAKLGHPEFLLIKDDTVQINPKYLC